MYVYLSDEHLHLFCGLCSRAFVAIKKSYVRFVEYADNILEPGSFKRNVLTFITIKKNLRTSPEQLSMQILSLMNIYEI